ncbi:hypothetical protein GGR56DRAFT_696506 [Xylariaceae sp. FL0804]|nr:hypothetical protein GGR56DRAFT_696506 [Xylariaceae sp. FL0804]
MSPPSEAPPSFEDTPRGRALAAEHELCRDIQHPRRWRHGYSAPVMTDAEFEALRDHHAAQRLRPWADRLRAYPARVERERALEAARRAAWERARAEWEARRAVAPPSPPPGSFMCGHGQPRVFACAECALLREPKPPPPFAEDEDEDEDGGGGRPVVVRRWAGARVGREFHGFLALPLCVRYLVYEHLLVVGRYYVPANLSRLLERDPYFLREEPATRRYVLLPGHVANESGVIRQRYADWLRNRGGWHDQSHGASYDSPENPFTPGLLLGVCKEVQAEAAYIFLGRNAFVFPHRAFAIARSDYDRDLHEWGDIVPRGPGRRARLAARLGALRDVSIAFDMREARVNLCALRRHILLACEGRRGTNRARRVALERDPAALLHRVHEAAMMELRNAWAVRVMDLQEHSRLRRLQVDIEDAHCPLGCCRPLRALCRALFTPREWRRGLPEVLDVVGWRDEAERDTLREILLAPRLPRDLPPGQDLDVPEHIVFAPHPPRLLVDYSAHEFDEMKRALQSLAPQTKIAQPRMGGRDGQHGSGVEEEEEDDGLYLSCGMPEPASSAYDSDEYGIVDEDGAGEEDGGFESSSP